MSEYRVYDETNAPEGARETLEQVKEKFGFVPNLLGVMSESPALAKAYATIGGIFEETSFDPVEQQVVLLAVSRYNECHYCVAAHSALAEQAGLPENAVQALRDGRPLPDEKLEALRRFTTTVVDTRGWPGDEEIEAFLAAGYERRHILDVIVGVGMKTLSNYTNHIAETPLDDVFGPQEWAKAG